jgi:Secretion system C-terminal sorting domain
VPAAGERRVTVIRELAPTRIKAPEKPRAPKAAPLSGLREDLKVRHLKYYPNPSKGRFHVSLEAGKSGNLTIQVLDPGGQVFHEETFPNFKGHLSKEIDISGSPSGIYYLRVIQGSSYLTRKVVLK